MLIVIDMASFTASVVHTMIRFIHPHPLFFFCGSSGVGNEDHHAKVWQHVHQYFIMAAVLVEVPIVLPVVAATLEHRQHHVQHRLHPPRHSHTKGRRNDVLFM